MAIKKSAVATIFGVLAFIMVSVGYCQEREIDNQIKKTCNQLMQRIYEDILKEKANYKELESFDKSVLQIRKNGIYSITYQQDIKSHSKMKLETSGEAPFQFSLAIVDIDECWQAMNWFENLKYPNLKLKFYGFFIQPHSLKSYSLKTDLTEKISYIVYRNAKALAELDRECLPLKLIIKSDKKIYMRGQSITIDCEFKNTSNRLIKINEYYKAGSIKLYFHNGYGEEWGLIYDIVRKTMPAEISPQESIKQGQYAVDLKDVQNYKILGKHSIHMIDGNLTSNSITIKVVETKTEIDKVESIEIAKDTIEDRDINLDKYYIKEVVEIKRNDRDIWFITFDQKEKIKSGIMMLGGEIFVDVDKKSGTTAIRYGE